MFFSRSVSSGPLLNLGKNMLTSVSQSAAPQAVKIFSTYSIAISVFSLLSEEYNLSLR